MAGNNKAKDKKTMDQQKKASEHGSAGDFHKTKMAAGKKQKSKATCKSQKSGGWSCLGKLNMLLLLTFAVLAVRVFYLHSDGDSADLTAARHRIASSLEVLAAAGKQYGGQALGHAQVAYDWAAGHASRLDSHLVKTQPTYYMPVKKAAGSAASTLAHYGGVAGERALVLSSQTARHAYEAAGKAWRVTQPYANATLVAARPYLDSALERAGPLWDAASEKGRAVKAGVIGLAVRLREDAGPVVGQWTETAQKAAGSAWDTVQSQSPVYAEMAWNVTCRASVAAWGAAQTGWKVVRTEVPVYAEAAGNWVTKTVASLTGAK